MTDIRSWLAQAQLFHQHGELAQAEPLYARVVQAELRNFDALHAGPDAVRAKEKAPVSGGLLLFGWCAS